MWQHGHSTVNANHKAGHHDRHFFHIMNDLKSLLKISDKKVACLQMTMFTSADVLAKDDNVY